MEFIIGPLVAVLLSGSGLYLTDRKYKKNASVVAARLETIEKTIDRIDNEVPKRMVTLMGPLAHAVKEVRREIGVE